MNYYAVLLSMLDEEKSKTYRPEHLAYLEELEKTRNVFAKGRFTDGAGGLIIYIARNLQEAKEFAKNDPYVKYGAREYEIHEYAMTTNAVLPE